MPTFDVKDAGAFQKYITEKTTNAATRGVLSAAMRTVSFIQTSVIPSAQPHMPIDRGIYRAGWQFESKEYGADVYNAVPYAPIIEDGARAENIKIGRAMIDALTDWVKRKGIGLDKKVAIGAKGIAKAKAPKPPLEALVKKITKYLKKAFKGGAQKGPGGGPKKQPLKLTDAQARSIAWAIAKSMQKKGIFNEGKGLGILKIATKSIPKFIEQEVLREIRREFPR